MKKILLISLVLVSYSTQADYLAITDIKNNRITSYMNFSSEAEAQLFLDSTNDKMPTSFIYNNLSNTPYMDLWVDGQAVTVVPKITLNKYKSNKKKEIRLETKRRLVLLLGNDGDETETLFDVVGMFNKLHKGLVLDVEETTLRAQLESLEVNRKAIRRAAKTAIQSVNAATTKAEVDAVTVSWP